jgi:coatomer subunit beta'
VRYLGFSETRKLLDVHPLELRFPLESKRRIECPVTLTNRTDHYVGVWITPTDLFFRGDFLVSWEDVCPSVFQLMEPHSTRAVVMAVEEQWGRRPRGKGKLDVLMIVLRSKEHLEKLRAPVIGSRLNIDMAFLKRADKLEAEVHQGARKAIICDPASCQQEMTLYQCPVAWSIGFDGQRRPLLGNISCIDAHPTDTR